MKKIEWSEPALEDLAGVDAYWWTYSPAKADLILDTIRDAGRFLAETPEAGPRLQNRDARKWRVRGTNYVLLYRSVGERLEILRVHHSAQNWRDTP